MHCTSSKYGGPSYHILRWQLFEHTPIILHAPTVCTHVHQATPHKDIRLETTLNDLLVNTAGPLQSQSHWHMHSVPPQE
jgi:hypothetical protein